jgi:hypothetical protein
MLVISMFFIHVGKKDTLFKRVETQIIGATVTERITLGVVSVFKNNTKAVRRLH